jgi:hypothetical protein
LGKNTGQAAKNPGEASGGVQQEMIRFKFVKALTDQPFCMNCFYTAA